MAINKRTINAHIKKLNLPDSTTRKVRLKTDLKGLWLNITNKGLCSWTLIYRFNNKQISYVFGQYDPNDKLNDQDGFMSEVDAISEAIRLKAEVSAGVNVKQASEDKKAHQKELNELGVIAKVGEFSVNDVFDYFIKKYANKNWREGTLKNLHAKYDKHIRESVGRLEWDSVTFRKWRTVFDDIASGKHTGRPAEHSSRDLAKYLRQAHKEALYAEKVTNSDIQNIELARVAKPSQERDRVLNELELGKVWDWCSELNGPSKIVAYILLSTSARTHEVRVSKIDDWCLTTNVWTVKAENSKNKDRIVRPIPDHLRPIIEEQIKTAQLIGSPYLLGKEYSQPALSTMLGRIHQRLEQEQWSGHDLRRTCSTLQNELSFSHTAIESMLGHRQDKIQRTYNKSSLLDQKRELADSWHKHLEHCKEKYLALTEG